MIWFIYLSYVFVFDTGSQQRDKEDQNKNSSLQTDGSFFIIFLNALLITGQNKKNYLVVSVQQLHCNTSPALCNGHDLVSFSDLISK